MILTDTHTHLYYQTDAVKRDELMQRCFANNVGRLFLPNVDVASVEMVNNLVNAYPQNCFAMLGLHPCSVKSNWQQVLATIRESENKMQLYAIGEIGIDLYWDKTTLAEQIAAFKYQIGWAKALKLPIVIHCREAFDEVFAVLEQEQGDDLRGILHCFTGTLEQAQKVIGLGFHLGIGGVVTYKNGGIDKFLAEIELQHIVLETDSPYLSPVPYRGKPNESSYLLYIAQKVADIYHTGLQTIADATTANSKKVFGA